MPSLFDLVPEPEYVAARDAGYVAVRSHPTLPYVIHNYTDRATWDQAWSRATLTCRGLITTVEGAVLARPFQKFMNYGQPGAPEWHLDDPVVVMDKADGSLGILYPTPDGWAIATRGAFVSEQAVFATRLFRDRYAGTFVPNRAWTYLFEIVYPENRIVVSYGEMRDLILLGAVDIESGASVALEEARVAWPGPVVDVFPFTTLRHALSAPARENAEGFVVWHPATDTRVKIKLDEYKRLHRLLTGVTAKHVWEILAAGDDPELVFAAAPDEFHGWLKDVIADLTGRHARIAADVRDQLAAIVDGLPDGWVRRDLAEVVIAVTQPADRLPLRPMLFQLADGRDIAPLIWKLLRPVGERPVRPVSGDAD